MKTAIQEAIEWINETQTHNVFDVQDKLIELLEKEKQQIIDACQCGFYCGNDIANKIKPQFRTSKDYYNNTFKTIQIYLQTT